MLPFWYLLKVIGLFRVPANEETVGLDASYHGGTAYPGHGADDFLDKSSSRHGKTVDEPMDGNGINGGGDMRQNVGFPSYSLPLIHILVCYGAKLSPDAEISFTEQGYNAD